LYKAGKLFSYLLEEASISSMARMPGDVEGTVWRIFTEKKAEVEMQFPGMVNKCTVATGTMSDALVRAGNSFPGVTCESLTGHMKFTDAASSRIKEQRETQRIPAPPVDGPKSSCLLFFKHNNDHPGLWTLEEVQDEEVSPQWSHTVNLIIQHPPNCIGAYLLDASISQFFVDSKVPDDTRFCVTEAEVGMHQVACMWHAMHYCLACSLCITLVLQVMMMLALSLCAKLTS